MPPTGSTARDERPALHQDAESGTSTTALRWNRVGDFFRRGPLRTVIGGALAATPAGHARISAAEAPGEVA
jgi:hypothetical protein